MTKKTAAEMTDQEVFDLVVGHLRKMSGRSIDELGRCMYHDEKNNRQCAVGCLLPRELAIKADTLTLTADGLCKESEYVKILGRGRTEFYIDLQEIHDGSSSWSRLGVKGFNQHGETLLRDFAEGYDLIYTAPETRS